MWNPEKPNSWKQRTDLWLPEVGDDGVGKIGQGGHKVQASSYKINKSGDVMYGMVTIVNNAVLYI